MPERSRDRPAVEPTAIENVYRVRSPIVSYNSSALTEVHRAGWDGLFGRTVDHLCWIVTSAGVDREWGRHAYTTDRYSAVLGSIEVALHDGRPGSRSRVRSLRVRLDADAGDGLIIPPGVWHTFRAVSATVVLLNSKDPPYMSHGVVDKEKRPLSDPRFPSNWDALDPG